MDFLNRAIAKHFAGRHDAAARLYHRAELRGLIRQYRAIRPKPAQARAQAVYLEQCRRRALAALGA